jgi:hypothetical protein
MMPTLTRLPRRPTRTPAERAEAIEITLYFRGLTSQEELTPSALARVLRLEQYADRFMVVRP